MKLKVRVDEESVAVIDREGSITIDLLISEAKTIFRLIDKRIHDMFKDVNATSTIEFEELINLDIAVNHASLAINARHENGESFQGFNIDGIDIYEWEELFDRIMEIDGDESCC